MKHDVSLPHSRQAATSGKEMKDANKSNTLKLHVAIEDQFSLSVMPRYADSKVGDLVSNDV